MFDIRVNQNAQFAKFYLEFHSLKKQRDKVENGFPSTKK